MREVAGSTPGLDFYILCEPICFSLVNLCMQLIEEITSLQNRVWMRSADIANIDEF
jgi:hypothetical protein